MDESSREKRNFIKVAEALIYAGNALQKYTENGLIQVHRKIYRRSGHLGQCTSQCSKTFGRDMKSWCRTCFLWKQELVNTFRHQWKVQKIDWKQHESWKWEEGYRTIAAVFLGQGHTHDVTKINLSDLSTALSIWDNCIEFNVSDTIKDKLREARNRLFGHNTSMKVPDHKAAKTFNILRALFRDPDVTPHIDMYECLDKLEQIINNDVIESSLERIENELRQIQCTDNNRFSKILEAITKQNRRDRTPISYFNICYLLAGINKHKWLILVFLILYLNSQQKSPTDVFPKRHKNCLQETYAIPFTTDIYQEVYLLKHSRLFGRQWLIDEIHEDVLDRNTKRGMILTSDMGYGKSALISHLICATEGEYGSNIRKHIISYHVCKFDVLSTKNPAIFIRRLVGFIGKAVPEFGSLVSLLPNTSILFDKTLCEQDANGCFDQAILYPLQDLTYRPKDRKIILIDALDECIDEEKGINKISELIRIRAHTLPHWLIFLLTSRQPVDISLAKQFHVKTLSSADERNYKDIEVYIDEKKDHSLLKLLRLFGSKTRSELIEKLVQKSGGNFLFLTHALEYWGSRNNTICDDDIPESLDRIYELNFERLFGPDGHDFTDAKVILEVICAALYQMQESEVAKIVRVGEIGHMSEATLRKTFERLAFCLKRDNGLIFFTHVSIRSWLLSDGNNKFCLSVQHGASLIADYLFHGFQIQNVSDVGLLALHIGLSNNSDLANKFRSVMKDKTLNITETNVLHYIAKTADIPSAVDLISEHYENIDIKDAYGFTASAIAAMKGHLNVFKRLMELKANIKAITGFGIQRHLVNIPGTDMFRGIDQLISFYPYENSTLMHIASQHGHLPLVKYIMKLDPSLAASKNMYGRFPLDLACEYGHDSILRYLMKVHHLQPQMDCLYLATRNQQDFIVNIVLSSEEFSYGCISENQTFTAYNSIKYKVHDADELHVFVPEYSDQFLWYHYDIVRPLDVWWKIKKESPLHIAARIGNTNIFQSIVSKFPGSLNCVDSGGLTPTLVSIRHGALEIFKFCLDMKRETDVCVEQSPIIKALYNKFMQNEDSCVEGMTVAHFLAVYGTADMIIEAARNGLQIEFIRKDNANVTPMHYAACRGNALFLHLANKLGVSADNIFSANGSSLYHSAASCSSLMGILCLTEHVSPKGLPHMLDSSNMSIFHYMAMIPLQEIWGHLEKEKETRILSVLVTALRKSTANYIQGTDNLGRNFFHYAILNGHFDCVSYFLTFHKDLSVEMLTQKDHFKEDPVTFTVRRLDRIKGHPVYRVPRTYHFLNLFTGSDTEGNLANLTWFMSPVDLTLYNVIIFASEHGLMDNIINEHFGSLMLKTKMYLVSLVLLLNQNTTYNFDKQIIEALQSRPAPHNILVLALLQSSELIGSSYLTSPIHFLSEYMDEVLVHLGETYANEMLTFLFRNRSYLLETNVDNYGRTIYESAIRGKSLIFIAKLINSGMLNLSSDVTVARLFQSILKLNNSLAYKSRFSMSFRIIEEREPGMLLTYQKQYLSEEYVRNLKDDLLILVINKTKMQFNLGTLCEQGKKGFSLIHLAAASDMYKTIQAILDIRPDIIFCETIDGATPLYLAKMFKAENTVKILETTPLKYPKKEFEKVLIFKLSTLFCDSLKKHPFFLLLNNIPQKRNQNQHKQSVIMKVFYQIFAMIKKPTFDIDHDIFYFYRIQEKDKILYTLRFYNRGLSMMNEMLSSTEYRSCRKYQIFLTKFRMKLVQVNQQPLSFYFLHRSSDIFSIPDHLKMYKYLWTNESLFKDFERCSTVRANRNIIIILRHFTKRFIQSIIDRTHSYIFNSLVNQEFMSPPKHVERYQLYFNYTDILLGKTIIDAKEINRYRFIDILKGIAKKDDFPLIPSGKLKVKHVQVETAFDIKN